jgi:hypothetical protein
VNEIATRSDSSLASTPFARTLSVARPNQLASNDHFDRMGKWLELFIATEQVASVLARTAFVPEPMRGQPENIAAAMMKSLELGIDPLDGLSCIHVVKGKIGFSAEFMRRRIIEAGHEIVIDESTDDRCKIRGRRAGSAEWQTVTFTADQARRAKINLGDYPADKLVARASSRLCRRVFPDVLAGTTIVDEIDDNVEIVDGSAEPAVQRKRQPRKVSSSRKGAPSASPDDVDELLDETPDEAHHASSENRPKPETPQVERDDLLDDADGDATETDSTPRQQPPIDDEPVTKPQLQKLSILRQREGYDDNDEGRADWFRWVETNIGRRVGTNKDLTKAEASVLIEVLESAQAQDPQR